MLQVVGDAATDCVLAVLHNNSGGNTSETRCSIGSRQRVQETNELVLDRVGPSDDCIRHEFLNWATTTLIDIVKAFHTGVSTVAMNPGVEWKLENNRQTSKVGARARFWRGG